MSRPLLSFSIIQLEAEFERAKGNDDALALKALVSELQNRNVPRARALREAVNAYRLADQTSKGSRRLAVEKKTSPRRSTKRKPTPEQAEAIELFGHTAAR